jgi:Domain of unknown function (DUF1929)
MRNPLSRGSRRTRAAVGALALALPLAVVASTHASAGVNMIVNAGLEQPNGGFPLCYSKAGSGTNKYSIGTTKKAHSGSTAIAVTISSFKNGQRMARIGMSQSCAPYVIPGHQYGIGVWYMSNSPDNVIELYRHDEKKGWVFWMDLKTLKASGHYVNASVRTPVIPAGTDQIAYGVALYGKGTLITDDYSMSDATVKATATTCSAGAACTRGAWQVLPFNSPVRSVHTVLLYNGDVLFVAGSGNNPSQFAAGTFESAVYNPTTGKFRVIPTPDDFFCAGHVQLANGNVLILGGNKAYPTAATKGNYEGLNTSYIFDPVTEKYIKENNLASGAWYPSATELSNGDVISYGGLNGAGQGSTVIDYFEYNQSINESAPNSGTDGKWLPEGSINQSFGGWGLYPAMILTQSGQLFYSGSHVFGNNETPVGDDGGKDGKAGAGEGNGGAGFVSISGILDPGSGAAGDPTTPVNGLQDNPGGPAGTDMTDQSMSVLLPPAQTQEVFLAGGGNILNVKPGTRLTDLINLNATDPTYTHGPLLPRGTLSNGKTEPVNDGKMYPSMVLLPNGNVFETGGALINREDPVYEASMINTANLESGKGTVYTEMAHDPQPRGYHSQSLLLPDGRVLSIGNNPGDGSFNMKISVYTPPYLFDGARPQVKSVQSTNSWRYGGSYAVTSNVPIKSAELLRPAAVTHQSDPNQRFVALSISGSGDSYRLNVPSNPNITPPGWYMLFVTNGNNVPSVAKWVHVS